MGTTYITIEQSCNIDGTLCTILLPSHVLGDIVFTLSLILFFQAFIFLGSVFTTFIKRT